MSNCFDNDLLWNHIEAYIDKVADGLIDNVIKEVESIDESDYQDAHNHLAFEEFKRVNNIESDNNFYEFDYINGTTVLDGYTQITHDQYEELYVKLPELVEHKRETIDD